MSEGGKEGVSWLDFSANLKKFEGWIMEECDKEETDELGVPTLENEENLYSHKEDGPVEVDVAEAEVKVEVVLQRF